MIRLCGEVLAAPTENEEIQFLCIVCAKLKQDPYLVNFFLEVGPLTGRGPRLACRVPYLKKHLRFRQNKSKRAEAVKTRGADAERDGAVAPDTGQSPAEEQAKHQEEPQAAAAASASACSPTNNNNNGSNYNLVTSLLNLTKSPVSKPPPPAVQVVLIAADW